MGKYGPEKTPYLDTFYAVKQNELLRQIYINLRNRYKNFNTEHEDIILNLHGLPSYCFIKLSRLENYLPFLFFSLLPFWTLTKDDSK